MKKKKKLNNRPDSNGFWRGLGGNFDTLTQIINEFVDNSISDFIDSEEIEVRNIFVKFEEKDSDNFEITIEDTGNGISNLDSAFSIGNFENQESSLNEHGFGMKHALAAANKNNNDWSIITRTIDDCENDEYNVIKAPFHIFEQEYVAISDGKWPGKQETGTIVKFVVNNNWMKTLTRGLSGQYSSFNAVTKVLKEDLGYTYGFYIKNAVANITLQYKKLSEEHFSNFPVAEITPTYSDVITPGIGETKIDLGNGEVLVQYEFLNAEISEHNLKYYKANLSTSGVEIRINKRVIENNLFSEIWKREKHNSYNYLLVRLNIESDIPERLPSTTTNKDGLRQDDPKLVELYKWIVSKLPNPKKDTSSVKHELELFDVLAEKKKKMLGKHDSSLIINREQRVFTSVDENIRIDLYQSFNNEVEIYEGKLEKTTPKDVYQLLMYWDGLVFDGLPISKAILIASEHPESVQEIVKIKNQSTDQEGNNYKIELENWKDEDINLNL